VNFWDFRSLLSIIEHEGYTRVQFNPGQPVEAITEKLLAFGYAKKEFDLVPGDKPGLVDFQVFSDEEFPLYLCLSRVYNTFPFTAVTIQGDVFPRDIKDIEESGVLMLEEMVIHFEKAISTDQVTLIHDFLASLVEIPDLIHGEGKLYFSRPGGEPLLNMSPIVENINQVAKIERIHGTFFFSIALS
jgi:hypothetical protein